MAEWSANHSGTKYRMAIISSVRNHSLNPCDEAKNTSSMYLKQAYWLVTKTPKSVHLATRSKTDSMAQ